MKEGILLTEAGLEFQPHSPGLIVFLLHLRLRGCRAENAGSVGQTPWIFLECDSTVR